jgi:hypothetical protein
MVSKHRNYTETLGRTKRRAGLAIAQAEKLLVLSRPQAPGTAACAPGLEALAQVPT